MAARLEPALQHPEIVDLRRLSARDLEPLLVEETAAWQTELEWEFEKSADLVRRFVAATMDGLKDAIANPAAENTKTPCSARISGMKTKNGLMPAHPAVHASKRSLPHRPSPATIRNHK